MKHQYPPTSVLIEQRRKRDTPLTIRIPGNVLKETRTLLKRYESSMGMSELITYLLLRLNSELKEKK